MKKNKIIKGVYYMPNYQLIEQFSLTKLSNKNKKEIDLLTKNNTENTYAFLDLLIESRGIMGVAITKYRKLLFLERSRGQVALEDIDDAYQRKDYFKFKELLSELFLQYIYQTEIDLFIKKIKNKNCSIEYIYNKHKEYPLRRFFNIISTS